MKRFLILLLSLLWGVIAIADNLPALEKYNETIFSTKEEQRMTKEFLKIIRQTLPIVNDPIITDYIQTLGNKLVSHANTRRKFHFLVINDPTMNAFSGPGGYIGINTGIILAVNSEDELAAVIAHEIAHITQHHIERLIKSAKKTQLATVASILASIAIGTASSSSSLSSAASGAAISSMAGATQHMINFTREHEIEADNIGMKILRNSGFDPNAIPSIFSRMQRLRYNYSNEIPQALLTHPVTSIRIAEAKNRIAQCSTKKIKPQKHTFRLIRIRTKILTSTVNTSNLIKQLKTQLNTAKPTNFLALQYGYAFALYKNQQFSAATKIITDLQNKYPNEVLLQMLGAKLLVANKKYNDALNVLKKAVSSNRDYYPLTLQYAQTLITAKHSQEACDFIRTKIRKQPENTELHLLLAEAYAKNRQTADAYISKARAYELQGYNRRAAILLQQALKIPKLSSNNRIIIKVRLDRLKKIKKNL